MGRPPRAGGPPGVRARGELWLGTAVLDREGMHCGGSARAHKAAGAGEAGLGVPLLGYQHGPRLLELLRGPEGPPVGARERARGRSSHLRTGGSE